MEISFLHERGVVSCYQDYLDLPLQVLDDARIWMEGVALQQREQENRSARRGR